VNEILELLPIVPKLERLRVLLRESEFKIGESMGSEANENDIVDGEGGRRHSTVSCVGRCPVASPLKMISS
jgi:hypothetical protein